MFLRAKTILIFLEILCVSKLGISSKSNLQKRTCRKTSSYDVWFRDLLPDDYNKHQPPSKPMTNVLFTMIPKSILDLSTRKMEMSVEVEIYISWKDHRLNNEILAQYNEGSSVTEFPKSVAKHMWFPQLQFGNCKKCNTMVYSLAEIELFYYSHEEKNINALQRLTTTLVCHFNMTYYPFDKQKCSVVILSPINQPVSMEYSFTEVNISAINLPPDYELYAFTSTSCSYNKRVHSSCNSFNFKLRRSRNRSILLIFIPTAFTVVISWISFWLDPNQPGPRAFIGIISLLILTIQFGYIQHDISSTSTVMALDIWIISCISLVVASLLEYAYVNYRIGKTKRTNARLSAAMITIINMKTKSLRKQKRYSPQSVDDFSKYAFPLVFIVFNITFWSTYYA